MRSKGRRDHVDRVHDLELIYINMKLTGVRRPRRYRMRARAAAAALTGDRILRAVLALHLERFHDQITLEAIAQRAAVTVQTVLRRFGSRDQLIEAAARYAEETVVAQRSAAPVGDIDGAVENLLDHYERWGHSALRLLAQEERVPQLRALADRGRETHYTWVDRTFAPFIAGRDRARRRAAIIAMTDVFVWKVLRLDLRFSRTKTAAVLKDMLQALLVGRTRRV